MHIPVLLKEAVEILNPKDGEFIIDGTVGAGGHTVEILKRISPNGILLGIDWDETAIEKLKREKLKDCKNAILVQGNYANLPEILKKNGLSKTDGLIIDLGMSSDQLESAGRQTGRGFSFLKNEPLDMRYNLAESLTAAGIINSFRENDLADIFWKYGEERYSRKIAKKIVEERKKERILMTFDLVEIIKKAAPKIYEKSRLHPATRVFQALRIYVNRELENLEALLRNLAAGEILKVGGRAVIISFHSLEDRLVKNYFREMAKNEKVEILTKKPLRPTIQEIEANPRARSAKLRAIIIKN